MVPLRIFSALGTVHGFFADVLDASSSSLPRLRRVSSRPGVELDCERVNGDELDWEDADGEELA